MVLLADRTVAHSVIGYWQDNTPFICLFVMLCIVAVSVGIEG